MRDSLGSNGVHGRWSPSLCLSFSFSASLPLSSSLSPSLVYVILESMAYQSKTYLSFLPLSPTLYVTSPSLSPPLRNVFLINVVQDKACRCRALGR